MRYHKAPSVRTIGEKERKTEKESKKTKNENRP